jgi:hypothetical protein
MSKDTVQTRHTLAEQWSKNLGESVRVGRLTGFECPIVSCGYIAGPRAVAVLLEPGRQPDKVVSALSRQDCANLRPTVPFRFSGRPAVFQVDRYIRCEVAWPDELAQTEIRLSDVSQRPVKPGHWIAGVNERGDVSRGRLDDDNAHWLIAGCTGAGKTVALRNMIVQLSQDPDNALVLCDGKWGESLRPLAHLGTGPVAIDQESIRAALGWVVREMRRRYERGVNGSNRLICIFDEPQEFTGDAVIADLLRTIAARGRGAGVHLVLATQHPTLDTFKDPTTRRNLAGRIALRVLDYSASQVIVGDSSPRADALLGKGDGYLLMPGITHRIQGCYVDEKDFGPAPREPLFEEWPDFVAEDLGREPTEPVRWDYSGEEFTLALIAAQLGYGRGRLRRMFESLKLERPGSEKAARLLDKGREGAALLRRLKLEIARTACLPGS